LCTLRTQLSAPAHSRTAAYSAVASTTYHSGIDPVHVKQCCSNFPIVSGWLWANVGLELHPVSVNGDPEWACTTSYSSRLLFADILPVVGSCVHLQIPASDSDRVLLYGSTINILQLCRHVDPQACVCSYLLLLEHGISSIEPCGMHCAFACWVYHGLVVYSLPRRYMP
jgi:hypothetical protein